MNSPDATAEVVPTGHVQVIEERGRRFFKAFFYDADGKHSRRLGPAHAKPTTKRTARGAKVLRAGDGPKPTDRHLLPKKPKQSSPILSRVKESAWFGALGVVR